MKKIFTTLAVFATLISSIFAFDFNIEAGANLPMEVSYIETDVNLGFNVGADIMFNDLLGIGVDAGMFFPIYGVGYIFESDSTINIYYVSGFGSKTKAFKVDVFAGLAIRPLKEEKFSLVLTPGFNYTLKSVAAESSTKTVVASGFGVGADVKLSYNLTKLISLNGGSLITYTFFENGKITGNPYGFCPCGVKISPRISVGFKF